MDPYKILGCTNKENEEQITKKYKKLALKYHPDRNKSLNKEKQVEYENKFKEITRAFDILKKNNFQYNNHSEGNVFKKSSMDDIFKATLRKRQPDKPKVDFVYHLSDKEITNSNGICLNVKSTLKDVYNNKILFIGITHDKDCNNCFGNGFRIDTQSKCNVCRGKKKVKEQIDIKVESKYKKKKIKYSGTEDLGRKLSNIHININVNKHDTFSIINEYDILYKVKLKSNLIKVNNGFANIKLKFDYLDDTNKILTIGKPEKSFSKEYIYENLGLIKEDNTRGKLIINIIDSDMLLFKYK